MQPRQPKSSIASTVAECYSAFATVEDILETESEHPELQTALIDCLGQFRIWSGNTGAHQIGKSSLDHLLRDVPSVIESLLQLLSSLESLIVDVRLLLTNTCLPSDIFLDSADSSNSESSENEDAHEYDEAKQIFSDISDLISGLHRLSISFRNPTAARRYKKTMTLNTPLFEPYDIEHVRDKFPKASTNLICRLGNANARRRRWLKYRELRSEKLEQGDSEDVYTSTRLSETTVSSVKSKSIFDDDAGRDIYESSTQTSARSDTTSANGRSKMRVPSMPNEAINGQPFECPYCHRTERVSHRFAWKKHVYSDLRPYLCTFEDCTSPNETYENGSAWFHHELQNHRRSWACGDHCEMTFGSEDLMVAHLHEHSPIALTDARARASARMRIIPINEITTNSCPICDLTIGGLSKFRRHLGGHLEELALFVLPATVADSDLEEDQISSGDEIGDDMEKIVLKEHEKDGDNKDSAEMTAPTEMAETSDYLKRSEHPSSSTGSEELELLETDAEAFDRSDEKDDNKDDQSSNNAPSASTSSEKPKISKDEAEAKKDHQVTLNKRDDQIISEQLSKSENPPSPSLSASLSLKAKKDHEVDIDEKDDVAKADELLLQSTTLAPALASPDLTNFGESAFRSSDNNRASYSYGDVNRWHVGGWFCCGCGDGPKSIKNEIRCRDCHHNRCSNCGIE